MGVIHPDVPPTITWAGEKAFRDAAISSASIPLADQTRVGRSDNYKSIRDALADLPRLHAREAKGLIPANTVTAALARITAIRACAAAELAAIDAMIADVKNGLGLP